MIAGIAIVSVVIAFLFLFFISRDISRSKYYRMQLEKAKQVAESLLRSREKLMLTISTIYGLRSLPSSDISSFCYAAIQTSVSNIIWRT